MSIKKYETLLKTVDLGSLTRASEELGYTQSAISQIISGLEEDLGLKLLVRDRSGVRLTETGTRLLPDIRAVCEANEAVYRHVATLQGLENGSLRIGTQSGTPALLLAELLSDFAMAHPDIQFALSQGSCAEMERALGEGSLDCALLYASFTHTFAQICIKEEPLLAVFPASRTEEVTPYPLERLADETVICHRAALPEELRALGKRKGIAEKLRCWGQDEYSVLSLVAAGLGMSLLPELLLRRELSHAVVTRPCTPALTRTICLLYRELKPMPPLLRQFLDMAEHTQLFSAALCENAND